MPRAWGLKMSVEDMGMGMTAEQQSLSEKEMMDMTAEGQRVLGQGRADEALMLAISMLETSPNFAPALALQGDALERLGRNNEAYASYEKILDLGLDTPLDRIRAAHLQRLMDTADLEPVSAPPSRRQALLAAAAACVLVICASTGLVFASRGPDASAKPLAVKDEPYVQNFQIAPVPIPGANTNPQGTGSNEVAVGQTQSTGQVGSVTVPGGGNRGGLPMPGVTNEVPPLDPGVIPGQPSDVKITPNLDIPGPGGNFTQGGGGVNNDGQPEPAPIQPGGSTGGSTGRNNDPGIIDITVVDGGTSGGSGGGEMEAKALIQVARDAALQSNWAKAADAYEKALRAGAPVGSTNQRLAQCYEKLGRKADAIKAYERAIKAYEQAIQRGTGDTNLYKASLETCKQALKVLRGG